MRHRLVIALTTATLLIGTGLVTTAPAASGAVADGVFGVRAHPVAASRHDGPARDHSAAATGPVRFGACPQAMLTRLKRFDLSPRSARAVARMRCALIPVPSEPGTPASTPIKLMITKIPARNPARRTSTVFFNAGGPGGNGSMFPAVMLSNSKVAFDETHDLIGIDPRGTGFGDYLNCPGVGAPGVRATGRTWVAEAKASTAFNSKAALDCLRRYGRNYLTSFTVGNNAEDLEVIRRRLGLNRIDLWGESWGTLLGQVYQTRYPARVGRMVLGSVLTPRFDVYRFEDDYAAARQATAVRFADWAARRDATLRMGRTRAAVLRWLTALNVKVARGGVEDAGYTFTNLAPKGYPQAANYLRNLAAQRTPRSATTVTRARTTSADPRSGAGFANIEEWNRSVFGITVCNDSRGPRDGAAWIAHARALVKRYPLAGTAAVANANCQGWPRPAQVAAVRRSTAGSRVLLVKHTYESVTLPGWADEVARQLRAPLLTVTDAEHGSLSGLPCAKNAWTFLDTGRLPVRSCPGE